MHKIYNIFTLKLCFLYTSIVYKEKKGKQQIYFNIPWMVPTAGEDSVAVLANEQQRIAHFLFYF